MAALTGNQRISSRMQVQKEFVLLMLLTIAIFAPVLAVISPDLPVPASDYPAHAAYAMSLAEHTPNAMTQHPNILFQLLTIAVKAVVPPISYFAAAALVGLGCYLITAVLLYAILLGALPEMTHHRRWLAAGGALVLLIVCPILVTVFNHSIYMGYVSLNTLHNPTSVLSRPFALVLTVLLVKLFQSKRAIQGALLALALLTIGSILTKPNYILCLVPAVIIVLLVRLQRKQPLHLAIIIPGLIIPAALLMLLNYQVAYGSNTASSVAVAPFAFVALYDPSPLSWLIKLFASLAFPLAIMADRRAWHDLTLVFAWLVLAFGLLQMYALLEPGQYALAGNWIWGAQIALFVLFAMSLRWCFQHWSSLSSRVKWLYSVILSLHVLSGIFFLAIHLFTADKLTFWGWMT